MPNSPQQQYEQLQALTVNPGATPAERQEAAWSVINDVYFEELDPDKNALLLPPARQLLAQNAGLDPAVQSNDPYRLGADIALAHWEIVKEMGKGEVVSGSARLDARGKLATLIYRETNGTFNTGSLAANYGQRVTKCTQILLFGLLHSIEPGANQMYVVPARPSIPGQVAASVHGHAVTIQKSVPLRMVTAARNYDAAAGSGVLTVALNDVLSIASNRIPALTGEAPGSRLEKSRLLAQIAATTLYRLHHGATPAEREQAGAPESPGWRLVQKAAAYLARLVELYNPELQR